MGSSHRHLVDDDNDDEYEDEEEEDNVYMYSVDMNLDGRVNYQVACRASKANELNRQQEKWFMRGKKKMINLLT